MNEWIIVGLILLVMFSAWAGYRFGRSDEFDNLIMEKKI